MTDMLKAYNELFLTRLAEMAGEGPQLNSVARLLDVVLLEFLIDFYQDLEKDLEQRIKNTADILIDEVDRTPGNEEAKSALKDLLDSFKN